MHAACRHEDRSGPQGCLRPTEDNRLRFARQPLCINGYAPGTRRKG